MTLEEEMIEFLCKEHLPLYFDERELIKEFIKTFFVYYREKPK